MVPSGASGVPPKFMPHWLGPDASTHRPAIGSGGAPGRTMGVPVTACSPAQPASANANAMRTPTRTASLHRRNHELRAFLRSGRPARRDGLGLGVEADRIRSVLVEIAEPGALPAAERVVGERHRDCEIHAGHAGLHAL